MAKLIARPAILDWQDIEFAQTRLSLVAPDQITSVAPYEDAKKGVSAALKEALGFGFPTANRSLAKGDGRIIWSGRNQALLIDAMAPDGLEASAALTCLLYTSPSPRDS